ncbi:polymorphic toxin-type HINT domain-containing protein [Streptomyces sp. H39-C1]|uniref:polymorphic toxin-type HINT domain-containing protein n=1 Tax=Streptomyces sp. H39-C1 TaxID=3004355 RepID=UPI0022AE65C4|nr:polymorphic toxin-type HINT domain-containing protein [Streptomyces sp. H39-C1]MCZ4099801.1 polymorphic toxin-type HINT domain-containing protein [Streptomyces sp. H39-C1]
MDGRLASTDNQTSGIGEGWGGDSVGAVTRSYVSCKDDPAGTAPKVTDNCWDGQILHVVLNGQSEDIVCDAAQDAACVSSTTAPASTPTHWKLSGDPTAKVELVVAGNTAQNDTYDGDYWKITSGGKIYYYGRNTIPNYGTTHSAWTVPVYGAHSGDPCYKAAFASASCQQAWQWNLDEVEDVHGNAIVYYYGQEINYYGANNSTTGVKYTRGGWLDHIDYGLGNGSTIAPQRVQYVQGDRCVTGTCDPIASNTANWPDVPYDLNCNSGVSCANHAPSFWTLKRLKSINTGIHDAAAPNSYANVDTFALTQSYPATNDANEKPALWLDQISRNDGALPPVKFAGINLANRFNTRSGYANLNKWRIAGITTESGDAISVNYQAPVGCSTSTVPSTNTTACFPVYWAPDGLPDPILDWFNKYVVRSVSDNDTTGGSAGTVTTYDYTHGKAAWHYDDNETVKAKYRTYGQWRGYSEVQTRTGSTTDGQTLSDTIYYQGMDGDTLPGGATRSASVALSPAVTVPGAAASVPDTNQLAGNTRETLTYKGSGGPLSSAVVSSYWTSSAMATRARTGLVALTSRIVRPVATITTSAVTSGAATTWRTTQTTNSYEKTTGLLRYVDDKGDVSVPAQETCTTTSYAPINAIWSLIGLPTEVETDKGPCATGDATTSNGLGYPTGVNRPTDVLSDRRTYYDTAPPTSWPPALPTSQAVPTLGEATLIAQASDYTGGAFTYQVKAAGDFDPYGRSTAAWDALGNKNTTAYTTSGGQTTKITVTNAKSQTVSTALEPTRGASTSVIDANAAETDTTYDALGRTTAIWLPGRAKATQTANYTFVYAPSATAPSAITTKKLNEDGSYTASVQLYDALLRERQTQTMTPQGGRLLTDVYYDSRGWVWKTNHDYWDGSSGPNTTLVATTDPQVTNQSLVTYDSLGRPTLSVSQSKGIVKEQTKAIYGGDRTTVIPPTGGTPGTTITDGRGRTTETDSYTTVPTITGDQVTGGSPAATKFTFDASGSHGQNTAITDPGGNQRTYSYNLLGQRTAQIDPDTGTTAMTYNAAGRQTTSTDARGRTVAATYDVLGRKTATYDGPDSSAPKLASWTYDDAAVTNSIGRQTASSHYDSAGNAYTTATTGFNVNGSPKGTTITIPPSVVGLGGPYTYTNTYTKNVGLPYSVSYPAAGTLPAEKVTTGYNAMDMATSSGGLAAYTSDTQFDALGRVVQMTVGRLSNTAVFTNAFDEHTGALNNTTTTRAIAPQKVEDTTYDRDPAGNITRITDNRLGTAVDTQCFNYNLLGRMTDAWTATDTCAGAPSTTAGSATVGGPDAYWSTWTFDANGNRTTQTQHALAINTRDTTTAYTYGKGGDTTQQPDTLTGTQTTLPDGTQTGGSYTYDALGDTTTRTTTPGTDTLIWNHEGQLESLKSTGQDNPTTYTYDADGSQLLRSDPDGKTTLFLPGEEVVYDSVAKTTSGTRYISLPGGVTMTRTGAGTAYNFVAPNDQATGTSSLDATAQTPTFRLVDPYGNPRGTQPTTWPGDKGFVGGTQDKTTGLTHLGARDYDPALGRFISADPILEATDPNQIGGYAYAGDNPVTHSDPAGLCVYEWDGGPCLSTGGGKGSESIDRTGNTHRDHDEVGPPKPAPKGTGKKSSQAGGGTGNPQPRQICYYAMGLNHCGPDTAIHNKVSTWQAVVVGVAIAAPVAGLCVIILLECIAAGTEAAIAGTEAAAGGGAGIVTAGAGIAAIEEGMAAREEAAAATAKEDAAIAAGKACATKNSFAASTAVLLANGATTTIDHVHVGDQVLATDPVTGTTKAETVTNVIVTKDDKDFTDLTLHTPTGSRTITSTQHHPYWDVSRYEWVNAADLHVGDKLREPDGTFLTVVRVRNYHQTVDTYNLTVSQLHTYYVLAGTTPILVHNCGTGPDGLIDLGAASKSGAAADKGGYSVSGRALQKHAGRSGTGGNWPRPTGRENPTGWNEAGQNMLDDILTSPDSVAHLGYGRVGGTWQDTLDVRLPSGLGARFDLGGNFSGFLD